MHCPERHPQRRNLSKRSFAVFSGADVLSASAGISLIVSRLGPVSSPSLTPLLTRPPERPCDNVSEETKVGVPRALNRQVGRVRRHHIGDERGTSRIGVAAGLGERQPALDITAL